MFLIDAALAAAAVAAGYLLWKYFKKKMQPENGGWQWPWKGNGGADTGQADREERERQRQLDNQRKQSELLEKIVASIQFSTTEIVSEEPIAGTEPERSSIPTSSYNVRPINSMDEFAMLLPSSQLLDDDQFYGQLAAKNLLVGEFQVYRGNAKKVLVALFDGSGSMEHHGRVQWAKSLCQRLIERCLSLNAELILIVFTREVRETHRIIDEASARKVLSRLDNILFPDGGTSIDTAIFAGCDLVEAGKFNEARALLVTDGEDDQIDVNAVKKRLTETNIALHTVCIANDRPDLSSISNRYNQLGMYG
jgi:uncharacterized protein with von Willebrand factor type A (vWA) domain